MACFTKTKSKCYSKRIKVKHFYRCRKASPYYI